MPVVGREIQLGLEILGREVRLKRRERSLSQQALANAAGVSQSTISRLETGSLASLRLVRLAAIIAALAGYGPGHIGMQPSRMRLDFAPTEAMALRALGLRARDSKADDD